MLHPVHNLGITILRFFPSVFLLVIMGFFSLFVHYFDVLLLLAVFAIPPVNSASFSPSSFSTSTQITILFVYLGLFVFCYIGIFIVLMAKGKKRKHNQNTDSSGVVNVVVDPLTTPPVVLDPVVPISAPINTNFSSTVSQQPVFNFHFHGPSQFVFPFGTPSSNSSNTQSNAFVPDALHQLLLPLLASLQQPQVLGNSPNMLHLPVSSSSPSLIPLPIVNNTTFSSSSSTTSTSTTTTATTVPTSASSTSSLPLHLPFIDVDYDNDDDNNVNDNNIDDDNTNDQSDDNSDSSDDSSSNDDATCICEYCGSSFATLKNMQRHIANFCKKKPVPSFSDVNAKLMKQFVPFTFSSKYASLKWQSDSLLLKLIDVWGQYVVCDVPNYFKNVLEKTIQSKLPHCEPLSPDTMKTYKSNLAKLLCWLESSFPEISSQIKLLELLFNWDVLNTLLTKFQSLVLWQTKTFQNCCSGLRRFLVMLVDVDYLILHNVIFNQIKNITTNSNYSKSLKKQILPSLEVKIQHLHLQIKKTPNTRVLRETLEAQNKWVDFPELVKGWQKGLEKIQQIIKKKQQDNNDHKLLAQFLAFTLAVKLPPMRTQNLLFVLCKTEKQILEKVALLNDHTNKTEKQNYGLFNNDFTQFDLYYTKYKTYANYGVVFRSFSGKIVEIFHTYVVLTKKLCKINLLDGISLFFSPIHARPGILIQQAIQTWVDPKSKAGMKSIRYSISTFNALMENKNKISDANVKLIEEGCLHSKNVADHYYDKPSLKQKGKLIVETYGKIWDLAVNVELEQEIEEPMKKKKKTKS
jgi:hypothetical protein